MAERKRRRLVRSRETMSIGAKAPSGRSLGVLRALVASTSLALTALLLTGGPALARTTHPLINSFSIPCNSEFGYPADLALHYATNTLYILCPDPSDGSKRSIVKYDTAGNPVDFSANQPSYIKDNAIFKNPDPASVIDPGSPDGRRFGYDGTIAVDNSGGPNDGYFYVTTPGDSDN